MPQVRRVRGAGRAAAALWAVPLASLLRQEVPEEGLAARRAQVGREDRLKNDFSLKINMIEPLFMVGQASRKIWLRLFSVAVLAADRQLRYQSKLHSRRRKKY